MNLSSSNQRDKNFDLFGLLASRFLYRRRRGGKEPAPGSGPGSREGAEEGEHLIPDDEVSGKQREASERQKRFLELLKTNISRYNADYGDQVEEADRQAETHYETINLPAGYENLAATKAQVKSIMKKMRDAVGRDRWQEVLGTNPQYQKLVVLLKYVEEVEKLPQKGREELIEAHRGRLHRRHEAMTKAAERREGWEKKPAFKEISSMFDSLSDTKPFKGVWETPEGISSQHQRESRELFIALMAEKTNNFRNRFVLGENFGNNAQQNIKNFPFIYNEFLKYEGAGHKDAVSLEDIAAAKSAANEAERKLEGLDPAKEIIERNKSAGIDPSQLPVRPSVPSTKAWEDRLRALTGMIYRLEEKAAKEGDRYPALKPGWELAATQLKVYAAEADAYLKLSRLQDREKKVQGKFTRIELSHPARRKMVIELAMKKFVKAMDMVDNPHNNANWQQYLHPTVRRLAIANIYETGVATYKTDAAGNVEYEDNLKGETTWMLSALALSDYFNFKEVGDAMDADHWAVLRAAYLGGKIAVLVENIKPIEEFLADAISVKQGGDPSIMAKHPPALVRRFQKYSEAELISLQGQVATNRGNLEKFLEKTEAAIKEPYSPDSQKFIQDMRSGVYDAELANDIGYLGKIGAIDGANLQAYDTQMHDLQINFKTAELQDRNDLMFFEGLGMNIEGLEPAYLDAIKKDSSVKAEYWDELLLSTDKEEFDKLIKHFNIIIPRGIAGGKEDFIQGLISIRKKYKGEKSLTKVLSHLEEGSEDGIVLNVLRTLKIHLTGRAEKAAASDRKLKEIEKRLGGVHIGDKISNYVGGVWDMLAGPGQSMANRLAGAVLMYGFYKSARMAMKGEGKSGKLLRALFVAGAVEIAVKEVTGRGILDRLGLDAIAGAMEGTYEGVLLQDAEKNMDDKDITREAHSAALFELNDVPFHHVMEWYESSDNNGMPKTKGAKDLFPSQINLNKIGPKVTWEAKDKKLEARRVVWETVRHFFKYVGNKDNKRGIHHGKEALKERWITMVDKPSHKMVHSTYDHREWLKATSKKKKDISWLLVMRAEIDPREVDLTKGKTPVGKLEATAKKWYGEVSEWGRKYVYNPGSGYAEVFLDDMGEGAQDAKEFFTKVAEASKRKIYFTKEKVILWYGAHQYEIKRVAENHWNLLVTGLKMPFKIVYAVDQWAVPWTLTQLERIEETLRPDKLVTKDEDLTVFDITASKEVLDVPDENVNEHYSYFGRYQGSFLSAMAPVVIDPATRQPVIGPDGYPLRNPNPQGQWYYEDPGQHVGYFISEVTAKEAGVKKDDPLYSGEPANVNRKMEIVARKKARDMFWQKGGVTDKQIKDYMYPIHKVVKTTDPKKVYVFYRMPLKGSAELDLKDSGRWADYMDPNKHKDRETFQVDPSQTSWENLKRAFALDMGPARTLVSTAGSYVAQVPRFVLWNVEALGTVIKGVGHLFTEGGQREQDFDEAVEAVTNRPEAQKIWLDEMFTSAESEHKAMSDFYKVPLHAKLYKFSHDYALKDHKSLYLGILQGTQGPDGEAYPGTYYMEQTDPQVYDKMWRWYRQVWIPGNNNQADPEIEAALSAQSPEPAPGT